MPILKLDSADIFYETWICQDPGAPWIYLVNGHTRSHKDFKFFARYLVENGFNVASNDNRGSGESKIYDRITLDLMASDVIDVLDHLELRAPSLLGLSMGGVISMKLACAEPSMFQNLVLVSTCPKPRPWMMREEARWSSDLEEIIQKLLKYFGPDFRQKNMVLIKAMAKNIQDLAIKGKFAEKAEEQRLALKGFDLTPELGKIQCPTLVVHGDRDEVIEVGAAQFLHEHITGSELKIYENAGHLLIAESGRKLYQDVVEFIRPRQ